MARGSAQQPKWPPPPPANAARPDGGDNPPAGEPRPRLIIDHRPDRSRRMRLLEFALKRFRPLPGKMAKAVEGGSPRLTPHEKYVANCDVNERQVEGIWIYDMNARSAKDSNRRHTVDGSALGQEHITPKRIYYFAGGGWQSSPTSRHWAFGAYLATHLPNTTVSFVSYPLAPKCPARIAMPMLKTMYHTLMNEAGEKNERVILAGDSAGGNVALALTLWALESPQEDKVQPPIAVMAISPTTDLRHVDPRIRIVTKFDPILTFGAIQSTAAAWCDVPKGHKLLEQATKLEEDQGEAPWSAADPRISPGLGNIENLVKHDVKIHGVTGTSDVLAPEAMQFRDRCLDIGVEGEWLQWDGQMHCFPLAFQSGLRESTDATDWIVDVLRRT